jgi:hypothetical protein
MIVIIVRYYLRIDYQDIIFTHEAVVKHYRMV